jgi:phytoene dehydrogenase-like protein
VEPVEEIKERRSAMAKPEYDVIVVGAGFGGSSCAGLLAKRGLKVLLLDKNSRAGGKAVTLSKKGFTHTPWVIISAPVVGSLLEVVLKELGVESKVKLVAPSNPESIYRTPAGKYVAMPQMPPGGMDPDVLFNWLGLKKEEKEEALKLFTELIGMSPQDIDTLHDISLQQWLSRYNAPRPLYSFFVSLMCDGMFVIPVDALAASEAVRTIQDMILRSGGLFCQGGIGRVAEAYAEAVESNGSKVIMRSRVKKITVEKGRVTGVVTEKGSFKAPIVISNAGIQPTVLKLVGEEHFDQGYVNYVKELVPSMGFMGARYFLSKKVTDAAYGVIFSNETPWSLERFIKAKSGDFPKEFVVYYECPTNYDPHAAPRGKHILMTGFWCSADPQMTAAQKKKWWDKGEEIIFKVFSNMPKYIEAKEGYSTREVSALARDQVLPGQGGECIGIGQIVGQCAKYKPSAKSPIQGLFYVGTDAGGYGVGVHQAVDSGINVANMVYRYHQMHKSLK